MKHHLFSYTLGECVNLLVYINIVLSLGVHIRLQLHTNLITYRLSANEVKY